MGLRQTLRRGCLAGSLLVPLAAPAPAQQPTQAQADAIRQACRADYQQHCRGVPTGGQAALACLQENRTRLSEPCQNALGALQPTSAKRAEAEPLPAQPSSAVGGTPWPHTVTEGSASAIVYQPQVISWAGQTSLEARAAVALRAAADAAPVLGTIEFTAITRTDLARRQVIVSDVRVTGTHFPALDTAQAARAEARIKAVAAGLESRTVPLDSVLASLQEAPADAKPVATDDTPPVIFHSEAPAILVVFDGEPVLAPVGQSGLSIAVNTNWSLLTDPATGRWYLLDDGTWLAAPAYGGPYQRVSTLPAGFQRIPDEPAWADIRRNISPKDPGRIPVPTVFVSTRPAAIIVTDGPARLTPIARTGLQVVTNTQADLAFDPAGGRYYVLISGRWFSAPGLDGPWRFATPDLPADFARIPSDGPQARWLASVPGTAAAQEAIISAQIPRQATLKRDTTVTVSYVGAPEFRPIPGAALHYAVNTPSQVIEVDGKYYACVDGAWFAAGAPTGPFVLAEAVPPAIYAIPPSSPLHAVTYVHVYAATPEAVVVGYTGGYTMGIVSTAGVVVYGTGYTYPPVVIPAAVPVYLPYPYTYAGGVTYAPATGAWVRGGTVYGPYGAATGGTAYNPATGTWARGGAVYGPNGGAGAWSAYNPQTGAYAHGSAAWGPGGGNASGSFVNPATGRSGSTSQGWNPYGRWGSSTVSGPNQTVHTESGSNARGSAGAFSSSTGAEGAAVRGAGGNSAAAVKGAGGDVYAGHDGNAYRHSSDGWSKWNNGGWQPVTPPAGTQRPTGSQPAAAQPRPPGQPETASHGQIGSETSQQLERDRQARFGGSMRAAAGHHGGERFEGGRFRR